VRIGDLAHVQVQQLDQRSVLGARHGQHMRDGRGDLHLLADEAVCERTADRVGIRMAAEEHQEGFAASALQRFLELPVLFNSVHQQRATRSAPRRLALTLLGEGLSIDLRATSDRQPAG
jgi:hypothetical protein